MEIGCLEVPELVILDLYLPDLSGLALCRTLRETAPLQSVGSAAVVGSFEPDEALAGTPVGGELFVLLAFGAEEVALLECDARALPVEFEQRHRL